VGFGFAPCFIADSTGTCSIILISKIKDSMPVHAVLVCRRAQCSATCLSYLFSCPCRRQRFKFRAPALTPLPLSLSFFLQKAISEIQRMNTTPNLSKPSTRESKIISILAAATESQPLYFVHVYQFLSTCTTLQCKNIINNLVPNLPSLTFLLCHRER
jgi:hypothetical protein